MSRHEAELRLRDYGRMLVTIAKMIDDDLDAVLLPLELVDESGRLLGLPPNVDTELIGRAIVELANKAPR
jgi:hypothetical protein